MKRFAFLLTAAITTAMSAQAEPVVVELFASKNCQACPKAFKTLNKVSETEDILVLTWSVDYWDYLDTADPMAMPESKARQASYVERFGLRGPYTPQSVYNGAEQCPGNKMRHVKTRVAEQKARDVSDLQIAAVGKTLTLAGSASTAMDVVLVHYLPNYEGDMPNPVTKVETLGTWSGGQAAYDVTCENGCAVLVQEPGAGEIVGALALP